MSLRDKDNVKLNVLIIRLKKVKYKIYDILDPRYDKDIPQIFGNLDEWKIRNVKITILVILLLLALIQFLSEFQF